MSWGIGDMLTLSRTPLRSAWRPVSRSSTPHRPVEHQHRHSDHHRESSSSSINNSTLYCCMYLNYPLPKKKSTCGTSEAKTDDPKRDNTATAILTARLGKMTTLVGVRMKMVECKKSYPRTLVGQEGAGAA